MLYLDASAIVKLVAPEAETEALLGLVRVKPQALTSVISRIEVQRAGKRARVRALERRVQDVFDRIALMTLDAGIVRAAARLDPPTLRSLDAIHLATALSTGDELEMLVTYDVRLADAARRVGLRVEVPE